AAPSKRGPTRRSGSPPCRTTGRAAASSATALRFPGSGLGGERAPERRDCLGHEPVVRPGSAPAGFDETGLAQHAQVMRDRRLREAEIVDERAVADLARAREPVDYGEP